MTGDENQSKQIIPDVIIKRAVEVRYCHLLGLEITPEFLMFAIQQRSPSQLIYRTMLGGGHEPRTWFVGDAGFRPLFESRDHRVVSEVFGEADIAHDPCKTSNESGPFDPKYGVDCSVCIDSGHRYRSHHLQPAIASPKIRD